VNNGGFHLPHRTLSSIQTVSAFTFFFYLYFICDFFLRFPARIPSYSILRPTLVAVVLLVLLLFAQKDKFKDLFSNSVFKSIFFLVSYIIITLPLVEWPGSVLRENLDPFVKAVVFLFFTALIIDTEFRLKWFVGVFLFCQIFRVLEPLYLNVTQGYWGSATSLSNNEFADRLSGAPADVINPNELGFVIVTIIPFLHYIVFPRNLKFKFLYIFLMPLLFYALVLTMSRGAFIALLVIGFFIFKDSKRKSRLLVVTVIGIFLAFSMMNSVQRDRYLSLVDRDVEGGASADGRIRGMIKEFELGLTRPIVGHGLGTTPEAKTHKLGRSQASHNLYAELIIELGIIGFTIFMGFLVRSARQLFILKRRLELSARSKNGDFLFQMNKVLICLFWMYAIYSLNYWGLSQYYWYLLGGLTIVLGRLASLTSGDNEVTTSESTSNNDISRFALAKKIHGGRHRAS